MNRFAKQAKLKTTAFFQKRRWSRHFLPRKRPVAQKHRAISRQEMIAFSTPRWFFLGHPSPSPSFSPSVFTGVRTLTSQPNFLPNLLSNGAQLANHARGLRYYGKFIKVSQLFVCTWLSWVTSGVTGVFGGRPVLEATVLRTGFLACLIISTALSCDASRRSCPFT